MRYVKLIFQRFRRTKILKIIHFGRNDWNGYLRSLHVKHCSAFIATLLKNVSGFMRIGPLDAFPQQ